MLVWVGINTSMLIPECNHKTQDRQAAGCGIPPLPLAGISANLSKKIIVFSSEKVGSKRNTARASQHHIASPTVR